MNVKNQIKSLIALTALVMLPGAYAGNQGVFLYYGAGAGGLVVDEKPGSISYDPAGFLSLFLGIEEDGWALEYRGFATADTATEFSNVDYSVSGNILSLGYRTIEKNGLYYKVQYGRVEGDTKQMTTILGVKSTETFDSKAKAITLGIGMRLRKGNRIELDYSYVDPTEGLSTVVSKAHMVSLRYLFDGAPSSER